MPNGRLTPRSQNGSDTMRRAHPPLASNGHNVATAERRKGSLRHEILLGTNPLARFLLIWRSSNGLVVAQIGQMWVVPMCVIGTRSVTV